MFLNHKILKKLLKEAYKHRNLYLACKAESLYIAAGYWEMEFLKEYIPKETLGDGQLSTICLHTISKQNLQKGGKINELVSEFCCKITQHNTSKG